MYGMVDKIAIMNRARLDKRRKRDELVKKEAKFLFKRYKNDPLFLAGIVLYWAEGTRLSGHYRKYQLAFTNSDPNLTGFYCSFLRRYFPNINIDDWRAGLFLYPDIQANKAVSYWSDILGIPPKQFIKSQVLNSKNGQTKKLVFGTCCIYVNSKDACLTMQEWINFVGRNAGVIQR